MSMSLSRMTGKILIAKTTTFVNSFFLLNESNVRQGKNYSLTSVFIPRESDPIPTVEGSPHAAKIPQMIRIPLSCP